MDTLRIADGKIRFNNTPASFAAVGVLTVESEGHASILIMSHDELDSLIALLQKAKQERLNI